ncbi:MAG TPA: hypothetical protein VGU27_10610, partial [Candidatus Eisenbacteria bacterium]|nr:hypothetical protein [Candidatus Eisenbacteria bacterium]
PGDDFDPRWVNDQIVFVSTRTGAPPALYDGSPTGQLATLDPATGRIVRLAYERNGLLDPRVDLVHQRLVWARWWFNPWRSARDGGVTRGVADALAPDSVNQWQLVGAVARRLPLRGPADLADERLAAGGVADRRAGMGVQPAILPDGAIAAVFARNPGLAPRPGPIGVHRLPAGVGAGVRVGGAAIADSAASPYAEGRNLAAPGMCAPAALADGRLIVAADPGARGDFGLWLLDRGGEPVLELVNLPGTLELDPAPVVRRPPLRARPDAAVFDDWGATQRLFTYVNRDVFAGGEMPRTPGARLRIYADRPGPAPGAPDTVGFVDDVPVGVDGGVSALLPAGVPLFEQLTDADGRALLGAHGPAQVRGFNTGRAGVEARCVGCHLGHSAER